MGTIAELFESGQKSTDKGMFNNLVMLARVDGKIDDSEVKLLSRIASRLSLTKEQVSEIINNPNSYPMIPPTSSEDRFDRYIQFTHMMVIDGEVDPSEENLLHKYGITLGFTEEQLSEYTPVILKDAIQGVDKRDILDRFI